MDSTSVFDFQVRIVECPNCGAPVTTIPEGGMIDCKYCQALIVVERRAVPPQAPPVMSHAPDMLPRYIPDPARDNWVRSQLAGGYKSRLDVQLCFPPDLEHLAGLTDVHTWTQQFLPALRDHWRSAIAALGRSPDDQSAQHRVYWLARRQSHGLAFLAGDTVGQDALELRVKQRAVLETALNLLGTTSYGDVIRCHLSRAAALLGDLRSARAWLVGTNIYPSSVDVDGEIRLTYAALCALEGDARGILEVLGPAGSEIPVAVQLDQLYAECYRIHAYEVLGDVSTWSQLLSRARARHGAASLRGTFETARIAPKANARIVAAQRLVVWLAVLLVGVPTIAAVIYGVVALLTQFVLG